MAPRLYNFEIPEALDPKSLKPKTLVALDPKTLNPNYTYFREGFPAALEGLGRVEQLVRK